MSIAIMSAVWRSKETKGAERLVLLALADHCNDEDSTDFVCAGTCFPSIKTIAAKCCMDERRVQRIIGKLVKAGIIERFEKQGRVTLFGRSNLYRLSFPRCKDRSGIIASGGMGTGGGAVPLPPEGVVSAPSKSSVKSSRKPSKIVSKETSSVAAAKSYGGIFDDFLENPTETHVTDGLEEEKPMNKRGPLTRDEWIKFDAITAREFPAWKKTNNKAALNGIRAFVKSHGIDQLEDLYLVVKASDYLMARGGHTGINGKPVTPTWIFQKIHTSGEYRFDKAMANGYSNEAMAFVLEKNAPKPESRPSDDFVTVVINDGPERKVLKSLVSEDGKKRYWVTKKTPKALLVDDQGENWTEENWLEMRESFYRRHPEQMPEGWEAQAAEVRTRLGLHVDRSVK